MKWEPLTQINDDPEVWQNNLYTVEVHHGGGDFNLTRLGIIHRSGRARHDWRDFQQIKNEVLGHEVEAVELYPAMSRLMDTANQYFLFALPSGERFAFGFTGRDVRDDPWNPQATQRPLPADYKWDAYE